MSDIFNTNGFLNFDYLDLKVFSFFNRSQSYVNSIMDKSVTDKLFGLKLKNDITGHLRRLFFILTVIDNKRKIDVEIGVIEPNSYYIELYNTEVLRDKYLCLLDKNIVAYLFSVYELDYNSMESISNLGVGEMIIEGTEIPFKIN